LWTICSVKTGKLWNIFCRVIDNYGDIGVCWRLASGLATCGQRVRLWVDDASALRWMAPQPAGGIEIRPWTQPLVLDGLEIGNGLIEAFGCDIPPEFLAAYASQIAAGGEKGLWLNLEYLSAEAFVARNHGLPSPVMNGPGKGLRKHFYYPGFTAQTGGLLREPDLAARQARFDRSAWLAQQGLAFKGESLISLFCYEPPALSALLDRLAAGPSPSRLLVTPGRAAAAVRACIDSLGTVQSPNDRVGSLQVTYLPALDQRDFDHLLWSCDLNLVRGEDSLVRAIWANKPLVWQIYPQDDDAHHPKLQAFLKMLDAPPSLRAFHAVWNGTSHAALPAIDLAAWQQNMTAARRQLLQQDDLVTQVIRFAQKNR
jgi:uncharacterized repeat protein (TIGR03837 family)